MQGKISPNLFIGPPHLLFSSFTDCTCHSVAPPIDVFVIYVDGVSAVQLTEAQEFTDVVFDVQPGLHTIDFSYQYNIFGGIDEVYEKEPPRKSALKDSEEVNLENIELKAKIKELEVNMITKDELLNLTELSAIKD